MIDHTTAAKLTNAINKAFDKIGKANGTDMPKSPNNADPIAYEYHVASQLERIAKKRRELAEGACIKSGVLFDKEKQPRVSGTKESVFIGDVVVINLEVKGAAARVDAKLLIDELREAGVDGELLDRAVEVSTKHNRPAHQFSTMLRVG